MRSAAPSNNRRNHESEDFKHKVTRTLGQTTDGERLERGTLRKLSRRRITFMSLSLRGEISSLRIVRPQLRLPFHSSTCYAPRVGERSMLRKTILTTMLAGFILAAFGSLVTAEAGKRHHRKPAAQPTQDPNNIPTSTDPDARVRGMIDEMHRSSAGAPVAPPNKADTSGYLGGRPFFSNNPNDQPK